MDQNLTELEVYAYTSLYRIAESEGPVTPNSVHKLLQRTNLGDSPLVYQALAAAPTAEDGSLTEDMFLELARRTVTAADPWERVAVLHNTLYIVQSDRDEQETYAFPEDIGGYPDYIGEVEVADDEYHIENDEYASDADEQEAYEGDDEQHDDVDEDLLADDVDMHM